MRLGFVSRLASSPASAAPHLKEVPASTVIKGPSYGRSIAAHLRRDGELSVQPCHSRGGRRERNIFRRQPATVPSRVQHLERTVEFYATRPRFVPTRRIGELYMSNERHAPFKFHHRIQAHARDMVEIELKRNALTATIEQ